MRTFPIELIRSQFPALAGASVFLDNPAGTQVQGHVISAVSEAMAEAASNIGGFFAASKAPRISGHAPTTRRRSCWAGSRDAR